MQISDVFVRCKTEKNFVEWPVSFYVNKFKTYNCRLSPKNVVKKVNNNFIRLDLNTPITNKEDYNTKCYELLIYTALTNPISYKRNDRNVILRNFKYANHTCISNWDNKNNKNSIFDNGDLIRKIIKTNFENFILFLGRSDCNYIYVHNDKNYNIACLDSSYVRLYFWNGVL